MLYLIIIIAFLGLVTGRILRKYTLEEITKGKNYLLVLSKLVLAAIIFGTFYFLMPFNLSYLIGFLAGILVACIFKKVYFYLGLLLFLSFLTNNDYLLIISSLIFIYGLIKGSYIRNNKEIYFKFIYFIIPFLIYFIREQLLVYNLFLIAFAIGALFKFLISKDL